MIPQRNDPSPNKTSQHILGAAANLLGFCLFVITSLHFRDKTENNLVDEFTSIVALMLTISSVLSFFSIRTDHVVLSNRLERWANDFFLVALLGIFAIIVFIIIKFWGF